MVLGGTVASAQTWRPLGPPGGDVHSLAADPSRPERLFLGTADGHIFGSEDTGTHWKLLGRAGTRRDAVVTAIVVDPRDANILFASAWTQDPAAGGGVFRSGDGGRTWRAAGLQGQAVRALAMAPSDADVLVAGTLDGVYRSPDAGKSWERISPVHHDELRNFDSLAVDPRNPQTIYAGTFHLPWKTADGGRTWRPIHDGMIDDSDVMSFLVDRAKPGRIYASACSGIYRSENGAAQWKKIQGIPYTARRTYVITQDPQHPASVYAATSEGLWKTADAGMTWRRTTPQDWVVNAVVVPEGRPGRVVIGTEQLGVLLSDDDGEHFQDANGGFFHRQILALALDAAHPGRVLAVLAHAPEPVLATDDDGKSWEPLGPGLHTEQMLRVYAAPDGWWASLAHGGLMRYDATEKILATSGNGYRRGSRRHRPACARFPLPLSHRANCGTPAWTGRPRHGLQFRPLVCRHRERPAGIHRSRRHMDLESDRPAYHVAGTVYTGLYEWRAAVGCIAPRSGFFQRRGKILELARSAAQGGRRHHSGCGPCGRKHAGLYSAQRSLYFARCRKKLAAGWRRFAIHASAGSCYLRKCFSCLHAHRRSVYLFGLRADVDSPGWKARRWFLPRGDDEKRFGSHIRSLRD